MQEIILKAKEWALEETELNGTPILEHLELSNKKGQELATRLGANKDIVLLGTLLMDIKLGECRKKGKVEEHVERSAKATKNFLNQFNLSDDLKNQIINCVEGHHGKKEWICKEAEICANADCYRFIHPTGLFAFLKLQGKRESNFQYAIDRVEEKLEEKHNILSLEICKEELELYYKMFKELLQESKK
ncbi:hypothetical protein COY27_01815 [Candidatus Woesearchaeota archaeon CG_4_10_14_0_2_um_filter_33_13]|nr:MAG: hypothetical protein COY27_01815 [Candidatus Woesearchaeota archaeon CG_4_10_14_0_2_um_filter_33_13]